MWLVQITGPSRSSQANCVKFMIPSVRNSESQHLAVLEEANCYKYMCSAELETKVHTLIKLRPGAISFTVPTLDKMLNTSSKHYPYEKTWEKAERDPLIIAHSSGSTGKIKFNGCTEHVLMKQGTQNQAQSRMESTECTTIIGTSLGLVDEKIRITLCLSLMVAANFTIPFLHSM